MKRQVPLVALAPLSLDAVAPSLRNCRSRVMSPRAGESDAERSAICGMVANEPQPIAIHRQRSKARRFCHAPRTDRGRAHCARIDRESAYPRSAKSAGGRTRKKSNPRAGACRIGSVAVSASLLTSRRAAILSLILESISPVRDGDGSMLHSVWANEVLERVSLIIQLLSSLDRQARAGSHHLPGMRNERQTAVRLATTFGLLNDLPDHKARPCSNLLRHLVRDLVALFSPAGGGVVIKLEIEKFALPLFRRRALILAASYLVLRARCTVCAFDCLSGPQIWNDLRLAAEDWSEFHTVARCRRRLRLEP